MGTDHGGPRISILMWDLSISQREATAELWGTRKLSQAVLATAAAAKSLQSCPTLCDPIDGSPPGSPVPEILQARTLEWVAIFLVIDKLI